MAPDGSRWQMSNARLVRCSVVGSIIFHRAIVWLYHVVPAPPAPVPCSAVCSRSRHLILLSTCCRTLCVYIPRLEPDSRLKLLSILWAAVHYKLEACSGEHTALHGTGAGGAGTIGGSDTSPTGVAQMPSGPLRTPQDPSGP